MYIGSASTLGATAFTPSTPLPDPHYGHALVATNGFLYNLGGLSGTTGAAGAVNVYVAAARSNGTLGAWSTTTPLPEPVFYHSAVAANGVIYVLGGWHYINSSPVGSAAVYFAKANADGTLGAWQAATPLPQTLFFLGAAVWNGRIYVTGGWNPSGSLSSQVYSAQVQADGSLSSWTAQSALPEGVYTHAAVADGTLYVLGGVDNGGSQIENIVYYSSIREDGSLSAWSTTSPLPQALANHAATVANGLVVVSGGWTGSAASNAAVSAQVNSDGTLGAWSSFGTLPDSIYLHADAVSGNWLYVSGGNDGQNAQSAVYYASLPAPPPQLSTAPPTTTLSIGAPQFGSAPMFVSTGTAFSLSAVGLSGVASTMYALDAGTWTAYAAPIHVPTDGAHWLRYLSVDKLGNQEPVKAASFDVDGTAPTSTLVFGAPQAVLASGDVVVSSRTLLQAQGADPAVNGVASGVSQILAGWDSGALSSSSGPFLAPLADGTHVLTLQAVDQVGNVETPHSVRVLVDATAPQTAITASPAPIGAADGGVPYLSAAALVSISAQDPAVGAVASGVNHTDYAVDGGSQAAYSGAFGLAEGAHTVAARSVDNVGNSEPWRSVSWRVDGTAPQTTARLSGGMTLFGVDVVAPGTTLTLSAVDPVSGGISSGVRQIAVSIDGAPVQSYSSPLPLAEGAHSVSFRAIDNAGNAEDLRALQVSATRFLSQALAATQSVTVSGRASVTGDVTAPTVTTNGHAVINGTVTRAAPALGYDVAAAGAWAQAHNNDAAVASSLSSGALILSGEQTLVLPDGDYYFTGLSLSGQASLSISTRANIFLHGNLAVSGEAGLNASGDSAGLWIVSDGVSASVTGGGRAAFNLYAPSAAAAFSGGGQFAGRVLAQTISFTGGAAQPSTTAIPAPVHRGQDKSIDVAQRKSDEDTASDAVSEGRSTAVRSSRQEEAAPEVKEGSFVHAPPAESAPVSAAPGAAVASTRSPAPVAPQHRPYTWPGLLISSHCAVGLVADQGGAVGSPDGSGVAVPQGAASTGLSITVAPASAADAPEQQRRDTSASAHGLAAAAAPVQFGPEGTQFIKPVTLTLPFEPQKLPAGAMAENLAVYYWNQAQGDWQAMPSTVDLQAHVVRAQTTHFSLYQVMAGAAPQAVPNASSDVGSLQIACDPLRPGCQPMKFQNLPAGARLRVYTLTGALVKDLSADGSGQAQWDGTNQSGQPAASGLYFILAQGSGTTKTIKVAVER